MKNRQAVLIFHSSIGYRHISAAKAIQQEILPLSPSSEDILQNIRAFMNPVWNSMDERLFLFVAKHLPATF